MLRTTSAERLAELAADPGLLDDVNAVSRRLQTALEGRRGSTADRSPLRTVAYFSPEFGITEALPQYSGGLGVLAGDHLKAASDLGVPLVGVGLLYTEGYFRQHLDADGLAAGERRRLHAPSLGLVDTGVEVTVALAGDAVTAHVWRAEVGRIPLYLLDTDVAGNSPDGVAMTDRLYGGDEHHRLRRRSSSASAACGRCGRSASSPTSSTPTRAMPGSSGWSGSASWSAGGLPFAAAVEVVRGGGVFTTHTPGPAGIDRFPRELMERYFTDSPPSAACRSTSCSRSASGDERAGEERSSTWR